MYKEEASFFEINKLEKLKPGLKSEEAFNFDISEAQNEFNPKYLTLIKSPNASSAIVEKLDESYISDELTVDESVLINDHENGNGNESDPNSSKDSNILGLQDEIISTKTHSPDHFSIFKKNNFQRRRTSMPLKFEESGTYSDNSNSFIKEKANTEILGDNTEDEYSKGSIRENYLKKARELFESLQFHSKSYIKPRSMPFSIGKTQENLDELPEASLAKDVINKINKAHMSQRSFDLKEVVSKVVSKPLNIQVASSTRALSTDDWKVQDSDSRICELYEKIENLAAKNEWSYKQFSRQPTIQRPKTHWDNLLDEAMWMQADFVEEKKYKVSMAKTIADAVLDWHNASDKSLHVTKTFFKNDGTVNVRKKDTNVDMIPSSIFDISLKSESIAGETENNPFYENMLTYTLDNLNTENYQDIIEHGSIVPIQRLVDTFVIFQDEIPNSSLSAPFINDLPFDSSTYYSNLDFQAFSDLPLLLNKTRTNAATLTTKENAANIKSNKFEPSWNSIEDNFIRKRASELSFNWDLLATLLNNNSNLYSSQKRKAQDCSQRWSFISNTSPTNSAAQSNDHNNSNSLNLINNTNNAHDEKKRTSSRFAAFETVKKKSMKKKDTHTANSHNTSGIMSDAPSSSTQLSFINPIDLIKAKVLEDPISKRRMDQKEESTQQVQPQIQPGQPPIAISRPNTIGGRPYPVLRPGFPTNFQNIPNAMRNALGNIPLARASNAARIIAEHYQAGQTNGNNNIIQPNIPQGLHPSQYAALGYIPPNILSNPALFAQAAAAARNGGRLPQGLNNLRPSINMNQLNLNSPEGIALATHMQNTQNAILYQRALQMQHNSMINNIQNTQLPHSSNSGQQANPGDPRILAEAQRRLIQQIQDGMIRPGSGNYPNNINPMQLNQATLNQLAQMQNPMFRNRMPISMNNNGTTTATPVASAPTQPTTQGGQPAKQTKQRATKGKKGSKKKGAGKAGQAESPHNVTNASATPILPNQTPTPAPPSQTNINSPHPMQFVAFNGNTSTPRQNPMRIPYNQQLMAQQAAMANQFLQQQQIQANHILQQQLQQRQQLQQQQLQRSSNQPTIHPAPDTSNPQLPPNPPSNSHS